MKKFFVFLVCMMSVVSSFATDTYKVKFVKIGTYDRGTQVIFEGGKTLSSAGQREYTAFFNSLRSGDIVEVEEYENRILGIRKIGQEAPTTMTNGVIYDNDNYGGYYGGYYGGSYSSYGYGVGGGFHVQLGSRKAGAHIDVPVGTLVNAVVGTVQAVRARKQARTAASQQVVTTVPQRTVSTTSSSNSTTVKPSTTTTSRQVKTYQVERPSRMF